MIDMYKKQMACGDRRWYCTRRWKGQPFNSTLSKFQSRIVRAISTRRIQRHGRLSCVWAKAEPSVPADEMIRLILSSYSILTFGTSGFTQEVSVLYGCFSWNHIPSHSQSNCVAAGTIPKPLLQSHKKPMLSIHGTNIKFIAYTITC